MAERVRVLDLLRRPRDFDGRRITATGLWRHGFESSWFAGAWLVPAGPWPRSGDRERSYVRVTGTWRASARPGFGHLGVASAELAADEIEPMPLVTGFALGPGDLAARRAALEGELVNATVPIRVGHELSTVDGIPLPFPLDRAARDPVERLARAVVWIEGGELEVLDLAWAGEPRPMSVPEIGSDELAAHENEIVDVIGKLSAGDYWPRFASMEVVPPEITTTARAYLAFGRQRPEPEEVVKWRARLAAGPLRVRARGTVTQRHFSAYEITVLARS